MNLENVELNTKLLAQDSLGFDLQMWKPSLETENDEMSRFVNYAIQLKITKKCTDSAKLANCIDLIQYFQEKDSKLDKNEFMTLHSAMSCLPCLELPVKINSDHVDLPKLYQVLISARKIVLSSIAY